MARSSCIFALVAVFAVMFSNSMCRGQSLTEDQTTQIRTGVDLGKAMADTLVSTDFKKSLTTFAKSIGPYLGTLGPLVGLVLAFIPTDSAVLLELKKMAEQIDNRFDKIDSSFAEVKNMIKWNQVAVNFGQIEQTILAMEEEYKLLYKASPEAATTQKQIFISKYRHSFDLSATKLYNAIVKPNGIFQENLGKSAMRYTKYNRRQTQSFLQGVLRLMTRAVQIEIAAIVAQRFDLENTKSVWTKRTKQVVKKFMEIDAEFLTIYITQAKQDTIDSAVQFPGLSHSAFAQGHMSFLKNKYYWRDWLVVVYDPIWTFEKHCISTCGGYVLFRQNGRNIVVASVDKKKPAMDLTSAGNSLSQVELVCVDCPKGAEQLYDSLDKKIEGICSVGVIRGNSMVGSFVRYGVSSVNRFKHAKKQGYYALEFDIHMFG